MQAALNPTVFRHSATDNLQDGNLDLSLLWQELAGFGREQLETFQYAAYYTTLLQDGLRVISYNSNYGFVCTERRVSVFEVTIEVGYRRLRRYSTPAQT